MTSKSVSILGATGSIGESSLAVIREHRDKFRVKGLAAKGNAKKLAALAKEFGPEVLVLADETKRDELKEHLGDWSGQIAFGDKAIAELAAETQDFVISAITGISGLQATYAAAAAGNTIGLANKESLVCAGRLLMETASANGAEILPLDSEHSAIFQCLKGEAARDVSSITLTASGGPFRGKTRAELQEVTLDQALKHPNWAMGPKVTIDSATLFNKGLEYIEAAHLFGVKRHELKDKLKVLVHPQSIVHSFVTFQDGSTMAQMGVPDMKTPIAVALAHPHRLPISVDPLVLTNLTFEEVDHKTFPGLSLAMSSLAESDVAPIVFNAANEVAVERFLAGQISFLQITELVEKSLDCDFGTQLGSIDDVWRIDDLVRQKTNKLLT